MPPVDLNLLIVPLLAVLAPLAARGLGRWVRMPIVVFELALGIVAGPAVLGIVEPSEILSTLSQFGIAFLFFVAGSEIDFSVFRAKTGRSAVAGWLLSLALGLGAGFLLAPGEAAVIIAIALCSTSLGTILPILRDAGDLATPFGRSVGAIGAVGEFGPLLAISLFLGGRQLSVASLVVLAFVVIAGVTIWLAFRIPHGRLHRIVKASLHTSGQFAVRIVVFTVAALVVLSIALGLDMLLGAFVAGIVWRLVMRDADEADRHIVNVKIDGLAFGFFVPLFFIYTGVTFDLSGLLAQPWLFALLPVVLIALLVVRGLPAVLAAPAGASVRERASIALFGSTALPVIVAVTSTGAHEGLLSSTAAAVLVGAGMLSVLFFPLAAVLVRGDGIGAAAARPTEASTRADPAG